MKSTASPLMRLLACAERLFALAPVWAVPLAANYAIIDSLPLKETMVMAYTIMCGVVIAVGWACGRPYLRLATPYHKPVQVFVAMAGLSLTWCVAWRSGLRDWGLLVGFLLYARLLLPLCLGPRFRSALLTCVVLVGALLTVLAFYQLHGFDLGFMSIYQTGSRQRVSTTIGHNNGVASQLLCSALWTLGLCLAARRRPLKLLLALLFLLQAYVMIALCLTRAIWLAFPAAALLFMLLVVGRLRWGRVVRRVCVGGALMLLLLAVVIGLRSKAGDLLRDSNFADTVTKRLATFRPEFLVKDTRARLTMVCSWMLQDYPWGGLGFGAFDREYPFWMAAYFKAHPDSKLAPSDLHTQQAHDDYLQTCVELGALGCLLIFWLGLVHVSGARRWLAHPPYAWPRFVLGAAGLCALTGAGIDAVFGFPMHVAPNVLWILMSGALWCALSGQVRQVELTPKPDWLPSAWVITGAITVAGLVLLPTPLPSLDDDKADLNPILPNWRTQFFAPIYNQFLAACYQKKHAQGLYLITSRMKQLSQDPMRYHDTMMLLRAWLRRACWYHPTSGEILSALAEADYFAGLAKRQCLGAAEAQGGKTLAQGMTRQIDTLFQSALEEFNQAGRDYQFRSMHFLMGRLEEYLAATEPEQNWAASSLAEYRLALAFFGGYDEARLALAQCLGRMGKMEEAFEHWAVLLKTGGPFRQNVLRGITDELQVCIDSSQRARLPQWVDFLFERLPPTEASGLLFKVIGRWGAPEELAKLYDCWLSIAPGDWAGLGSAMEKAYREGTLDHWLKERPQWYQAGTPEQTLVNLKYFGRLQAALGQVSQAEQNLDQIAEELCEQFHQKHVNYARMELAWRGGQLGAAWEEYLQALGADQSFPKDRGALAAAQRFWGVGWPMIIY